MERHRNGPRHALLLAALGAALVLLGGCSADPDFCRFDPGDCAGGIGGYCDYDSDCQDGYCCREMSNCGGGMCTYACDRDDHCPPDMACEHGKCFFTCRVDADCAHGMECEHDGVCEWP